MKTKSTGARAIRRVVTGTNQRGQSVVLKDGAATNDHQNLGISRYFTDLWVWNESPAPLTGNGDDGDGPYNFPSPPNGGHLRIVEWPARPVDYDPTTDPERVEVHEPRIRPPGRTWDRGGNNAYTSAIHKTETLDYGIVLTGERVLLLGDRELVMRPGDTIVQLASWHQWKWINPSSHGMMAFDFIASRFDFVKSRTLGRPSPAVSNPDLPKGVKPTRRIVIADDENGNPDYVSDTASHDVRTDPARPGFASIRLWVTESTPAKLELESRHLPHTLEPPPDGSVLNMVTFPPDEVWKGKVGTTEARAYFESMGSPGASTALPGSPHPYMQKTGALDFCIVMEGEVVLVLDAEEVVLRQGDVVIQRGTNHAWSNRSGKSAVVAIASHAGRL